MESTYNSGSRRPANYPYHKPNPYQIGTYKYNATMQSSSSSPYSSSAAVKENHSQSLDEPFQVHQQNDAYKDYQSRIAVLERKEASPYLNGQYTYDLHSRNASQDDDGAPIPPRMSPHRFRNASPESDYQTANQSSSANASSSPAGYKGTSAKRKPSGSASASTGQPSATPYTSSPFSENSRTSPSSHPYRKSAYSQKSAYETYTGSSYQEDPYDANSIVESIDVSDVKHDLHNHDLYSEGLHHTADDHGSWTVHGTDDSIDMSNPSTLSYRGSAAEYGKRDIHRHSEGKDTNQSVEQQSSDSQDDIPPLTKMQKLSLVLILSVTLFMVALEQTIITSCIPQISAALNSSEGYTWIGTAYLLASCSVLPIAGKLSDIYGRKPIILIGEGFFLVGSAICGSARSMNTLIGGRAIQGLGCGIVMSLIHIIISDVVPLKERGLFISAVGSVWMIASCTGPLIGGGLATVGAWRWCFYINLPTAGSMTIALFFALNVKKSDTKIIEGLKRIDFVGVVLSIAATCLFLLALDWGGTKYAWSSAPIIVCFVLSAFFYVVFFVYEHFWAAEPLMPPRLFKTRTRSMSFAASFCHAITFMGIIYYLPFLFQAVYGASAIIASLYVLPEALIMGATTALGGLIISKLGRYVEMMRAGLGFTTVFIGLLSTLTTTSPLSQRILFPALYGFSTGFNFQSFLISLQTKVKVKDIGTSVAMMLYVRQLGLSISIAIGGAVFQNKMAQFSEDSNSILLKKLLDGAAPASVDALKYLPEKLLEIARSYYLEAFINTFYVFIAFSGLGFIFTLFIPQNDLEMKKSHTESKPEKRHSGASFESQHPISREV